MWLKVFTFGSARLVWAESLEVVEAIGDMFEYEYVEHNIEIKEIVCS